MIFIYLFLRLWFLAKDQEHNDNARGYVAHQDEKHGIETENVDLWKHFFGEFQNNWYFGDRSLVPEEYRAYCCINKSARLDFCEAWVADREQKLGWKPYCKPKGDHLKNFERKWGMQIRDFNARNNILKKKEELNDGIDVE